MPEDVQDQSATPRHTAAAPQCLVCKRPITNAYFTAGDQILCPDCRNHYAATLQAGSRFWRLTKATALGSLACLVAAATWFGIGHAFHATFSLAAIAVGLFVGAGVRFGSERRGGSGYQLLAVTLTYLALGLGFSTLKLFPNQNPNATASSTRAPANQSHATETDSTDDDEAPVSNKQRTGKQLATLIMVYSLSFIYVVLTEPARVVLSGIPSAIVIAISLWAAWKINQPKRLSLAGPHSLASRPHPIPQPPQPPHQDRAE